MCSIIFTLLVHPNVIENPYLDPLDPLSVYNGGYADPIIYVSYVRGNYGEGFSRVKVAQTISFPSLPLPTNTMCVRMRV